ncbi:MAG: Lrp/AsnC family transcriptional regulator [Candidatus Bathyarchaeia archaeon]
MRETEEKLFHELVKNSKRSDRELAKLLGVSQPTVTRTRKRLEKELISEYTIIPVWEKFGFEIMAFTYGKTQVHIKEEQRKFVTKAREWMNSHPNVIFSSSGHGMGMNSVTISFHRNYTCFSNFLSEYMAFWGDYLADVETFLVSIQGGTIFKLFSFKYLTEAK